MKLLNSDTSKRIDAKLLTLNRLRPLSAAAVKKLREQLAIEMAYNSNAIEGNSLTLKETFLVISEGVTIKNKPLKDHLEAKDHFEALEFLADLVAHDTRSTMSEHLIRTIHQLVVRGTEREWAGRYRNSAVVIAGAKHRPPDALAIPEKMAELIRWYQRSQGSLHPVEAAALLHHKFVHIHPFFDGNGRTSRLLMNVVLMRRGYPLAVVLKNDRKKYYAALDQADAGDAAAFVRLMAQSVERSLDIYLKTLTPAAKRGENFMSLSQLSRRSKFSAKYLNLLVRQGKLEAHKENRDWISSPEALQRYLDGRKRKRS
jgi:Fic family protein